MLIITSSKKRYNRSMKNLRALLSYGFLIWLIPFVTSFFIFTLRESDRYFFETLMTLILVGATSFVLIRYSKRNRPDPTKLDRDSSKIEI